MLPKDFHLSDLINLEDWQKIQDSLSEAIEITIRTFSPDGNLLSRVSKPNPLCEELVLKASTNPLCNSCISGSKIQNISSIKEHVNIHCPFGLDVFVIPIKAAGDKVVAYVVLGPVITENNKDVLAYKAEAEKIGISPEAVSKIITRIKSFAPEKVKAMVKLIDDVFSHIALTGYHKKRLGEIYTEVAEIDPLFSQFYEEKILRALLDACTLALNADSGSVMTINKKTGFLHIKVAEKLDEDIINRTQIKMGEGIAGVAAATCEPIILPKDKERNHLSEKMKREYIKSSLIVPFNKGTDHEVYGVVNLNILRKNIEFSERDIAFVKELVNMASVALTPVVQNHTDTTSRNIHSN